MMSKEKNKESCILVNNKTGKEVALKSIAVKGSVKGLTCQWEIVQKFANLEKQAIEAVYSFPLPADATLNQLKIIIGDKTIVTRPEEREEAFEKYDEAIQAGNAAFLLDQERPDFFVMSLGNILPGQEVEVQISMFQLLQAQANSARISFPVAIVPKYFPAGKSLEAAEWERVEPEFADKVPYGFNLTVKIMQNSPIRLVESPSHPIRVIYEANVAEISLAQVDSMPDSDVVINFELAEKFKPMLTSAFFNNHEHVLFEVFPDFAAKSDKQQAKEVMFLVDCSGSMAGDSIKEAKSALQLCVRSLNEGDTFQVICFGSSWKALFAKPLIFNQESLENATRQIAAIDAEMGGTEILSALGAAIKALQLEYSSLVLFTDGAVGNEEEVIKLAASKKSRCRIFSFGIGNGASENLVKGIADKTGGKSEFIFPGERIEPKVLRQFNRLSAPCLSDLKVTWSFKSSEIVPVRIPSIFSGEVVRFAARLKSGEKLSPDLLVKLEAQQNDQHYHWESEGLISSETSIPALWWAQQQILELENNGEDRQAVGSKQGRKAESKGQSTIVELSEAYGILCSKTSLIGIEERSDAEKNDGKVQLRKIPVMVPANRECMESLSVNTVGLLMSSSANYCLSPAPCVPVPAMQQCREALGGAIVKLDTVVKEVHSFFKSKKSESTSINQRTQNSEDKLIEILMCAGADGSFVFTDQLIELLGVSRDEFAKWLAKAPAHLAEVEKQNYAMTLLVKHQLETVYQSRIDMWSGIVAKIDRKLQGW